MASMDAVLDRLFIEYSCDKLKQLSSRIEDCLGQADVRTSLDALGDHDNSVGNLVLHLCGNVGQWIGTGIGGRPNLRDRDAEFAAHGGHRALGISGQTSCTIADAIAILIPSMALASGKTGDPELPRLLCSKRSYHVVEHFAEHTGQILFATNSSRAGLGYYKHSTRRPRREGARRDRVH